MTNRDRLLMMTASGIVRDIRPECMNAAEILGRVTEALATRDVEIERLLAAAGSAASILSQHLAHQFSDQKGRRKLQSARDGLVQVLSVNQQITDAKP